MTDSLFDALRQPTHRTRWLTFRAWFALRITALIPVLTEGDRATWPAENGSHTSAVEAVLSTTPPPSVSPGEKCLTWAAAAQDQAPGFELPVSGGLSRDKREREPGEHSWSIPQLGAAIVCSGCGIYYGTRDVSWPCPETWDD